MAGNTRGKLKEHFEGVHRNFEWILYHVEHSIKLIDGRNPKLSESIESLGEGIKQLDELAQGVYGSL